MVARMSHFLCCGSCYGDRSQKGGKFGRVEVRVALKSRAQREATSSCITVWWGMTRLYIVYNNGLQQAGQGSRQWLSKPGGQATFSESPCGLLGSI